MLFANQKRTRKNVTWSQLNRYSVSKWRKEHNIRIEVYVTLKLKSVTVSVAVSNMGVVLHQAWSESHRTVSLGHLTLNKC